MTRSLLPPIRTRRFQRLNGSTHRPAPDGLTPGTRRTVAAIGALLVSFAVSSAATSAEGAAPGFAAGVNTPME
jgi:hypothetical protein